MEPLHALALMPLVDSVLSGHTPAPHLYLDLQQEDDPELQGYFVTPSGQKAYHTSETQANELVNVRPFMGVMMKHGSSMSYGVRERGQLLLQADHDPKVVAHVLHMETPGGSTGAIKEVSEIIAGLQKPVVGWIDDLCCSAGMWLISGAQEIYANDPQAMWGSIGVMVRWVDLQGKLEKEGATIHEVYASQSERKNEIMKLAREGKYERLRSEWLDPMADDFHQAMKANLNGLAQLSQAEQDDILSGATFTAEQGLSYGVIDGILSFEAVIKRAFELGQQKQASTFKTQTI